MVRPTFQRSLLSKALLIINRKFSSAADGVYAKTAGIIVIGDEILKGDVRDTNSNFMTSRLHKIGVRVKKISIIGDDVDGIAKDVNQFSNSYNYVITTGGIGPTHDDVSYEGVAKAFREELYAHPELMEICCKFYETKDPKAPGMKLAFVPKSSVLIYGTNKQSGVKSKYPVIRVHNVYMFPGIPQLFETAFETIYDVIFKSHCKFYTRCVYLKVAEYQIAQVLDSLVKEHPKVCVGSYPTFTQSNYTVKVTIESMEEKKTTEAYNKLIKMIPNEILVTESE